MFQRGKYGIRCGVGRNSPQSDQQPSELKPLDFGKIVLRVA